MDPSTQGKIFQKNKAQARSLGVISIAALSVHLPLHITSSFHIQLTQCVCMSLNLSVSVSDILQSQISGSCSSFPFCLCGCCTGCVFVPCVFFFTYMGSFVYVCDYFLLSVSFISFEHDRGALYVCCWLLFWFVF